MKKTMDDLLNEIFNSESIEQLKSEWNEILSKKVNSPSAYSLMEAHVPRILHQETLKKIPIEIENIKIEKAPTEFGAFFLLETIRIIAQ